MSEDTGSNTPLSYSTWVPRGRKPGTKNFEAWQKQKLQAWVEANNNNLYPSKKEKRKLAREVRSSKNKVSNWFINLRKVGLIIYSTQTLAMSISATSFSLSFTC